MIDALKLQQQIDTANAMERQPYPRIYLGMSSLGRSCLREVFLTWRFCRLVKFSPRMLRLFNRGHEEEDRFVHYLRTAGYRVYPTDPRTGRQFEFIKHHGHEKGHCDGIAYIGGQWVLLEMKTHSNKSFVPVKRMNNLAVSKHEHYCQVQKYMDEFGLKRGLYMAVNKDNDAMHLEWVERDEETVEWINDRELELLTTEIVPNKISEDSSYWKCNNCSFHSYCFDAIQANRTCRMCVYADMEEGGAWSCQKGKGSIKRNGLRLLRLNEQLKGCRKIQYISGQ